MRFSIAATTALSLLARCVFAATADPNFDLVTKPEKDEKIDAGSTYTLVWKVPEGASKGPITIALLAGPNRDLLQPVGIVAKGIANSLEKYDWAVNDTLGSAPLYGLTFTLEEAPEHFQFSNQFHIVAKAGAGGSSSGSESSKTGDTTATTAKTTATGATTTTETSTTGGPATTSQTSGSTGGTTSRTTSGPSGATNGTSTSSPTRAPTGGAAAMGVPLVAAGAYALGALLL